MRGGPVWERPHRPARFQSRKETIVHFTTVAHHFQTGRVGNRSAALLKRFGIAGILFFAIKGLLWLLIPAALAALI